MRPTFSKVPYVLPLHSNYTRTLNPQNMRQASLERPAHVHVLIFSFFLFLFYHRPRSSDPRTCIAGMWRLRVCAGRVFALRVRPVRPTNLRHVPHGSVSGASTAALLEGANAKARRGFRSFVTICMCVCVCVCVCVYIYTECVLSYYRMCSLIQH